MKRLVCKFAGHQWGKWKPRHGRFRYRFRRCDRCDRRQMHDVQLNRILEIPR